VGDAKVATVRRLTLEGYAISFPDGWAAVLEESSYSDPDQTPPHAFARRDGTGTLYVGVPLVESGEAPRPVIEEVVAAALRWGARRGYERPLAYGSALLRAAAMATALFRIDDELVQVWILSNGRTVVQASYVCPWDERDRERADRERIVRSVEPD
jgi:hypothetical protein